jgi:hypothetical protein
MQPSLFRPLLSSFSNAVYGEQPATPRVPHLLMMGSPSAVARLVVAVVVDPIQAFSCLWLSHVSKEVLKDMPAFTYLDAPGPIPLVLG